MSFVSFNARSLEPRNASEIMPSSSAEHTSPFSSANTENTSAKDVKKSPTRFTASVEVSSILTNLSCI